MRRFLLPLLGLLVLAGAALWWFSRPLPILTIVTWPGAYGRAQQAALMQPYRAGHRIDVRPAEYEGGLDELTRAVASKTYAGDVIDLELPNAVKACRQGLLETIDPAILPPGSDGQKASDDFVGNAVGPCWVGSVVYSQLVVAAPGSAAKSLADVFDTARFPGRRALRRGAKYNLEMALLADGVAAKDVYPLLATPAGLDRAFARLESLGPQLLWLDKAADGIAMVTDGRAAFATALNGDLFDAVRAGHAPAAIWDRQLYEMDVFAVPKDDPKRDTALDFIAFATGSGPLAQVASWVPYGPTRRSAWGHVPANPDLKIAMTPWLPTSHFDTAFAVDDGWWLDHGDAIAPRWHTFEAAH